MHHYNTREQCPINCFELCEVYLCRISNWVSYIVCIHIYIYTLFRPCTVVHCSGVIEIIDKKTSNTANHKHLSTNTYTVAREWCARSTIFWSRRKILLFEIRPSRTWDCSSVAIVLAVPRIAGVIDINTKGTGFLFCCKMKGIWSYWQFFFILWTEWNFICDASTKWNWLTQSVHGGWFSMKQMEFRTVHKVFFCSRKLQKYWLSDDLFSNSLSKYPGPVPTKDMQTLRIFYLC